MKGGDPKRNGVAPLGALTRFLRRFRLRPMFQPESGASGRRKPGRTEHPATEPEENALERTARALSEFVVRVAALPLTLLMATPSDLMRANNMGNYRPLPSPFLLALVTGVVVSGVTSALLNPEVLQSRQTKTLVNSVAKFYDDMDGLESVVFAIPYLAFLWGLAGAVSALMWRGLRSAQALFVGLSLSLGAIMELAAVRVVLGLWLAAPKPHAKAGAAFDLTNANLPVLVGTGAFAVVLALKLVGLVFLLQRQSRSPWVGAVAAAALAFFAVVTSGLASVFATHWIVAGFG